MPAAATATTLRVPTQSATPSPACKPAPAAATLPDTATLASDPAPLTDYFDRGGGLPALIDHLQAANVLPLFPGSLEAASADVDGDGTNDLALSLQDPTITTAPRPPGALYVWLCRSGEYVVDYGLQPGPGQAAPVLLAVSDLTGDGAGEIIFGRPTCGAHTCFLAMGVLSWDGRALTDVFSGSSEDLPSPTIVVTPGPDGAGTIAVTAGGVMSVGAGPPRPRTRTWAWNPTARSFVPGQDVLAPPVFRVHVVQDADAAFEAGDLDAASALYQRALEDAGLQEWDAPPATPASLKAYVHYRLVLLALARAGREAAQQELDSMVEATTGVPEAEPYLALAELVLQEPEPVNLAAACHLVRGYATDHTAEVLDPLYYGYDNRAYTSADLCPFE